MKIADIMTKKVVTVDPETKITEVARIMHENRFHGVPVVKNNELVGIITETDFFIKGKEEIYLPAYIDFLKNIKSKEVHEEAENQGHVEALLSATAKDIMTSDCITLTQDSDIKQMLMLIKEARVHTVPVVDFEDKIVGIVTQHDVIRLI